MFRQRDYPRILWIGDNRWRVRFLRRLDPGVAGYCDAGAQEIQIRQGLGPVERLRVFVHETIHAIEAEHGFELPHDLVELLDSAVARFLADNLQAARGAEDAGEEPDA